jgi:hypothetical protein
VRAHVTLRYGVSYDEWVLSLGRPQRVDHLLVELVISRCVHLTHRLDPLVSLCYTAVMLSSDELIEIDSDEKRAPRARHIH